MTEAIYLALTHDWELRGDGSGDIEEIQFAPLRRLLGIYERFGARTTFLPDVMQQIRFRELQNEHRELRQYADAWDEHARQAHRRGHDVQLHLHSQWSSATYENGSWNLHGDWSLLNYDAASTTSMLAQCKRYLKDLLRPVAANYRCIAFRASALALAPSAHLLRSLADLGIEIDVSMAGGFYLNNETLQLDYRNCEEDLVPYYPKMDDARRISNQREAVVCVPLNHFYGSRRAVTRQNLALVKARVLRGSSPGGIRAKLPRLDTQSSGVARLYEKMIAPAISRKYFVSDTGRLNYPLMREMVDSIRRRARQRGLARLPVVLTNHPKDIRDWDGIERFVGDLAEAADIRFVTLTEIADKIRTGEFQVRAGTKQSAPSASADGIK